MGLNENAHEICPASSFKPLTFSWTALNHSHFFFCVLKDRKKSHFEHLTLMFLLKVFSGSPQLLSVYHMSHPWKAFTPEKCVCGGGGGGGYAWCPSSNIMLNWISSRTWRIVAIAVFHPMAFKIHFHSCQIRFLSSRKVKVI